ncbi:SGNH/GDSL hydrolase family protein [Candidatus Woesearchaeota archaeon]|nr:SGNH/GDSL hydrolase family protein [Candidatus Woesearchaeota archaeon]
MKKSQVTPFIIVGITIVILVAVLMYNSNRQKELSMQSSFSDTGEDFFLYIEYCLGEVLLEGIEEKGFSSNALLEEYVDQNIMSCIEKFPDDADAELGEPSSDIRAESHRVITELDLPVTITREGQKTTRSRFYHSLNLRNVFHLSQISGVTSTGTKVISSDKYMTLEIPENIKILGKDGTPVEDISLEMIPDNNEKILGHASYDFRPDGAVFEKPVLLKYLYKNIAQGSITGYSVAYYDQGLWKSVPCLNDLYNKEMTCFIEHFSDHAIHTECSSDAVSEVFLETGKKETDQSNTVFTMKFSLAEESCVNHFGLESLKLSGILNDMKINDQSIKERYESSNPEETFFVSGEDSAKCLGNDDLDMIKSFINSGLLKEGQNTISFQISPLTSGGKASVRAAFRIFGEDMKCSGQDSHLSYNAGEAVCLTINDLTLVDALCPGAVTGTVVSTGITCKDANDEEVAQGLCNIAKSHVCVGDGNAHPLDPEMICDASDITQCDGGWLPRGELDCEAAAQSAGQSADTITASSSACFSDVEGWTSDMPIEIKKKNADGTCSYVECSPAKMYPSISGCTQNSVGVGLPCYPDGKIRQLWLKCEQKEIDGATKYVFVEDVSKRVEYGTCTPNPEGPCDSLFNVARQKGSYPEGKSYCAENSQSTQKWESCTNNQWAEYDTTVPCEDTTNSWSASVAKYNSEKYDVRNSNYGNYHCGSGGSSSGGSSGTSSSGETSTSGSGTASSNTEEEFSCACEANGLDEEEAEEIIDLYNSDELKCSDINDGKECGIPDTDFSDYKLPYMSETDSGMDLILECIPDENTAGCQVASVSADTEKESKEMASGKICEDEEFSMVVMGDSITYGWNNYDCPGEDDPENPLRKALEDAEFDVDLDIKGLGSEIAALEIVNPKNPIAIIRFGEIQGYDVVVLFHGVNQRDDEGAEHYEKTYRKFAEDLGEDVTVIILTPIVTCENNELNTFPLITAAAKSIEEDYDNVYVIDIQAAMKTKMESMDDACDAWFDMDDPVPPTPQSDPDPPYDWIHPYCNPDSEDAYAFISGVIADQFKTWKSQCENKNQD